MEKEIDSKRQEISAWDRPIDHMVKIQNEHDRSDDTNKAKSEDNVDETSLFEAKVEIMDASKAKQKAKDGRSYAAFAFIKTALWFLRVDERCHVFGPILGVNWIRSSAIWADIGIEFGDCAMAISTSWHKWSF